jgi:hypothetical protein
VRHIYLFDDGERHWVSAESEDHAITLMAKSIGYDSAAEYLKDEPDTRGVQLPDDQELAVFKDYPYRDPTPKTIKTCGEWAAEKPGVIASTCY